MSNNIQKGNKQTWFRRRSRTVQPGGGVQSQSGCGLRASLWPAGLGLTAWAAGIHRSKSGNQRLQLSVSRHTCHHGQQDTTALTNKNLTYVSFSHLIWHPHFLQTVFFTGLDKPRCVRCMEKRSQTSVKTSRQQVQSGCENAVSSLKTSVSNHTCAHQALFPSDDPFPAGAVPPWTFSELRQCRQHRHGKTKFWFFFS